VLRRRQGVTQSHADVSPSPRQKSNDLVASADDVDLIVVTDGEGILGIGDWGAGGIAIAIGKLAAYTAAAGIDPTRIMPVVLDAGTNNPTRILRRYRNSICTFNDDMQGTGAVAFAALLASSQASGVPLREQRDVVFGAGTAGIGIAAQIRDAMVQDGLPENAATQRIWGLGCGGLLVEGQSRMSGLPATVCPPRRRGRELASRHARQCHRPARSRPNGPARPS
jgi:malate dehydrogenase (oxaloacetate-decarboxylating)